ILFLVKPLASSNGTVGKNFWCFSFQAVKSLELVNWFIRSNRGKTKSFHTSFNPQSCFKRVVIFPFPGIKFFELNPSSLLPSLSSRTIFDNKFDTYLLM